MSRIDSYNFLLFQGFTLDDVLSGRFYAESFNGTWISGICVSHWVTLYTTKRQNLTFVFYCGMTDTEFSYRSSQGGINIYNLATNTATEMISGILVVSIPFDSFLIL